MKHRTHFYFCRSFPSISASFFPCRSLPSSSLTHLIHPPPRSSSYTCPSSPLVRFSLSSIKDLFSLPTLLWTRFYYTLLSSLFCSPDPSDCLNPRRPRGCHFLFALPVVSSFVLQPRYFELHRPRSCCFLNALLCLPSQQRSF